MATEGGVADPARPRAARKRFVWDVVEALPVTKSVLAGYRRALRAEYTHHHRRIS